MDDSETGSHDDLVFAESDKLLELGMLRRKLLQKYLAVAAVVRVIFAVAAVAIPGTLVSAHAMTMVGHIPRIYVFGAAVEFEDTYDATGMSGVSKKIKECYSGIMTETLSSPRIQMCMILDIAAVGLDHQVRKQFEGLTGHEPPPVSPLLSTASANQRVDFYRIKFFGSDYRRFNAYFSAADGEFLDYAMSLDQKPGSVR